MFLGPNRNISFDLESLVGSFSDVEKVSLKRAEYLMDFEDSRMKLLVKLLSLKRMKRMKNESWLCICTLLAIG